MGGEVYYVPQGIPVRPSPDLQGSYFRSHFGRP